MRKVPRSRKVRFSISSRHNLWPLNFSFSEKKEKSLQIEPQTEREGAVTKERTTRHKTEWTAAGAAHPERRDSGVVVGPAGSGAADPRGGSTGRRGRGCPRGQGSAGAARGGGCRVESRCGVGAAAEPTWAIKVLPAQGAAAPVMPSVQPATRLVLGNWEDREDVHPPVAASVKSREK